MCVCVCVYVCVYSLDIVALPPGINIYTSSVLFLIFILESIGGLWAGQLQNASIQA